MKGKISVLRRGIAAFLMLTLIVGNAACLSGTVFAAEVAGNVGKTATGTTSGATAGTTSGATAGTTSGATANLEDGVATESDDDVNEKTGGETETNAEGIESSGNGMMVLFAQEEGEEATETTEATETKTTSSKGLEDASATDPVLSTYVPQNKSVKFGNAGRIYYENYHTQNFFVKCNGITFKAYCIEPALRWGKKSTYTAKPYDGKLMKKALYYSIGYPGYNVKTKRYLAGLSRKECYKGDKGIYCLCHIVLSYIYDNKKSNSDAFTGVSKSTKTVVKKFLSTIESWPDPPNSADIGLSASSIKAGWNEDTMRQETPSIEVTGTPGNTISVPVPAGAAIIKTAAVADTQSTTTADDASTTTDDSKNVTTASSGSVEVAVGESFSITAPSTVQADYKSPSIYGSMEVFQPYVIKTSDSQGQTFGMSVKNAVSYNIDWKDFGTVELKKMSSDEEITAENNYYSLENAKYGLYSKSTDTLYGKLATNAEGKATIEDIPYGDFYIKELKAPQGYELDSSTHDIVISSPVQSETVLEEPSKPDLETSAVEEETGNKSFYVRDNEAGVDTTIVDTVKYKNLTPGLEYRIDTRLVDKATGQGIPSQAENITFTPKESSGSLQVEYKIDSSELGGKSAVAFEKLYQGKNLIAVHEDINNKAQTVTILKPVDGAPETGDNLNIVLLALAFGVSFVLGLIMFLRKGKQKL